MSEYQPGDKVIHHREKDVRNYGTVLPEIDQQKPGWIAVYFQRKVWCKPKNLRPFPGIEQPKVQPENIKNYWTAKRGMS